MAIERPGCKPKHDLNTLGKEGSSGRHHAGRTAVALPPGACSKLRRRVRPKWSKLCMQCLLQTEDLSRCEACAVALHFLSSFDECTNKLRKTKHRPDGICTASHARHGFVNSEPSASPLEKGRQVGQRTGAVLVPCTRHNEAIPIPEPEREAETVREGEEPSEAF
eukprot:6193001-Pleurochrysis_carterae.AAC.5